MQLLAVISHLVAAMVVWIYMVTTRTRWVSIVQIPLLGLMVPYR